MTGMEEFFGLKREGKGRKGCATCGEFPVDVDVMVAIRTTKADNAKIRRQKSKHKSFCFEHGLERYEQMVALLTKGDL